MSIINFARTELTAAIGRGVRQCVLIGPGSPSRESLENIANPTLQLFEVTQFETETLAGALENFGFDKLKASLFVWLGTPAYRTPDAVMKSLAFIASLPKGSGVLFDYAVERTSLGARTQTALDALASRIAPVGGTLKYLIQPQAVTAMLRSLGFQHIVDLAHKEFSASGGHMVSAIV